MRAMILDAPRALLRLERSARTPRPGTGEVLIRVRACGVCRTDLHILDGDLASPKLPLVLGHEIVGTVVQAGPGVEHIREGDRVGGGDIEQQRLPLARRWIRGCRAVRLADVLKSCCLYDERPGERASAAAEDHQNARAVSERRRGDDAALAGSAQHHAKLGRECPGLAGR